METIFRSYHPSSAERSDRSAGDRLRHRQKIREAIRHNIADIIADESIIGKDRDRIIKVPIRGVKEYRFVYGENTSGVGRILHHDVYAVAKNLLENGYCGNCVDVVMKYAANHLWKD